MEHKKNYLAQTALAALVLAASLPATTQASDFSEISGTLLAGGGCGAGGGACAASRGGCGAASDETSDKQTVNPYKSGNNAGKAIPSQDPSRNWNANAKAQPQQNNGANAGGYNASASNSGYRASNGYNSPGQNNGNGNDSSSVETIPASYQRNQNNWNR